MLHNINTTECTPSTLLQAPFILINTQNLLEVMDPVTGHSGLSIFSAFITCSNKSQECKDKERWSTCKNSKAKREERREENCGPKKKVEESPWSPTRFKLLARKFAFLIIHLLQSILWEREDGRKCVHNVCTKESETSKVQDSKDSIFGKYPSRLQSFHFHLLSFIWAFLLTAKTQY